MATIALIALRSYPYAGGSIVQGDRFDAVSEADAALLIAVGLAEKAPPQDRQYVRKDLTPSEDVVTVRADAETVDDPPKRRYRRRDLTAAAE